MSVHCLKWTAIGFWALAGLFEVLRPPGYWHAFFFLGVNAFHICQPHMDNDLKGDQIKAIQDYPIYEDVTYPGLPGLVSPSWNSQLPDQLGWTRSACSQTSVGTMLEQAFVWSVTFAKVAYAKADPWTPYTSSFRGNQLFTFCIF